MTPLGAVSHFFLWFDFGNAQGFLNYASVGKSAKFYEYFAWLS